MESCKYHPVTPSTFHCVRCEEEFCDQCVDQSVAGEAKCFHCGSELVFQVTSDNVDPFWRRLEKAFKYPLNVNALTMVVGLSVVTVVVTSLPFQGIITWLFGLFLVGAMVNYSFMCLTSTSEGNMVAPSVGESFQGTISVLFKLLFMVILIALVLYAITAYIHPILGAIASIIVLIGAPAILMGFAHTQSVIESVNPVNFVRIMSTLGLPYAVLIIFLMIMMMSVTVLNQIIGDDLAALSAILQSSVSNYYSVVMFHLMGYMLFQYQGKLGYSTGDADSKTMKQAETADVVLAHVNIRLKEGEYDRVDELLKSGIENSRRDKRLWAKYFEFLYRTENTASLEPFADNYLHHLIETAQTDRLASDYKKIKQLLPAYVPGHGHIRFHVANACRVGGDSLAAVQLVNGMHKLFPDYEKLVAAYQLMKLSLDDLPNMSAQAEKCQGLIEQLKKKYPEQAMDNANTKKVTYEVKEPAAVVKSNALVDGNQIDATKDSDTPDAPRDLSPIEFK